MKRFFSAFWLITFATVSLMAAERAPMASVLTALEPYIDQAMAAEDIPGAVMVIVKDGKVVYLKGFGVKIAGQTEKVDPHTPFALASITKNFTNTLVARLVDQGKLHWKDKVSKYLPDFRLSDPKISQELTIEDLLSHRCGLPGFSADSLIELGWSAPEIISKMKEIPTEGEFRKTYTYQNAIVGLMGYIIEKATGKPLAQVYQEELFQPLGLAETHVGENPPSSLWQKFLKFFRKAPPQPALHTLFQGKALFLPKGNPSLFLFPASTGLVSTGEDIGKWLIFQLEKGRIKGTPLVSEAQVNETRTPHVEVTVQGGSQFPKNRIANLHYGMGWFIHDYAGVPMLSHMGGMAGTRTLILIIPDDNLGIAVLTNLGGMRASLFPEAIRNKFLDLYLQVKDEVDWAKKLREKIRHNRETYERQRRLEMLKNLAPARNLDDYTGVYENSLYGQVEIRKEGDALILHYRDRPPVKLPHWNGNNFQLTGPDLSPGFSGTDIGEVVFSAERGKSHRMMVTLFHEGHDALFHRVR